MNKSELLQFIENSADECVALQKLLTSHKALAPENGGDGEWDKCAALEQFLRAHGITNLERFDAPDSRALHGRRPNLIATIPGKKKPVAAGSFGLEKDSSHGQKAAGSFGLSNDSFSVQNYLGRVSQKSEAAKWGYVPKEKGGKFARTDFKILKKAGGLIFVQAKLWTGRTHQIRVHLAQSGLPILGDTLYGGRAAERIFLHALSLDLPHPISGQPQHFEAPLPPEFAARL